VSTGTVNAGSIDTAMITRIQSIMQFVNAAKNYMYVAYDSLTYNMTSVGNIQSINQ